MTPSDKAMLSLVIVTGQAGSGKSTAIRALEDLGFYCIDNLPSELIDPLLAIDRKELHQRRLALVMDLREPTFLAKAPNMVAELRQKVSYVHLIFLESDDDCVLRRYSQTRRLHPMDQGDGLVAAIVRERVALAPIKNLADTIIDTSKLSPHSLVRRIAEVASPQSQVVGAKSEASLHVTLMSFGFKNGVPLEADIIFDVRFLPNPYFVPELSHKSGLMREVADYVMGQKEAATFMEHALSMLRFLLPQYHKEGKRYLTVAIGCTGGRHRSVTIAQALRQALSDQEVMMDVRHRDVGKEGGTS